MKFELFLMSASELAQIWEGSPLMSSAQPQHAGVEFPVVELRDQLRKFEALQLQVDAGALQRFLDQLGHFLDDWDSRRDREA